MAKRGPKHGNILGIKISSTSREQLLASITDRLDKKDKFFIVTPNPEIVLMATNDWLLKKAIVRADYSVPDGIGLAQAYRFMKIETPEGLLRPFHLVFQGLKIGLDTLIDKKRVTDSLNIIKGRELFWDVIDILDRKKSRVYFFGGEHLESQKSIEIISKKYKNLIIKTANEFPIYGKNGQPATKKDRLLHKKVVGSVKLFEPDFIFVALGAPKQEKWILRNFFRLNATGAMAIGGTFRYVSGLSKLPPKLMERLGLEWFWRLITEPFRIKRILNAFPLFPYKVFIWKYKKLYQRDN